MDSLLPGVLKIWSSVVITKAIHPRSKVAGFVLRNQLVNLWTVFFCGYMKIWLSIITEAVRPRSKVAGFIPRNQHVNLWIGWHPE